MKKLILVVLALICLLGLVGCNAFEKSETYDRIPMVMVDDVLYLDTGEESGSVREDGLFDGEITSKVDQSQIPTENNQSNFGIGYGYQYGTNGTIEIYINEKWCIFEEESTK